MQMETRVCKCTCKRAFRVLNSSPQRYASELCKWAAREFKPPAKHTWNQQTQAALAEVGAKKRGRPKGS